MAALLNFWNTPNKEPNRASVNGTTPDSRGTKRKAKAKANPYDDIDDDDDDIIPARRTPTSQRTARSRPSTATPGSGTKPHLSLTGKRRSGRPSLKSQQGDVPDTTGASRTNAETNSPRAKTSDTTRLPPDSFVPEAPMGDLELLSKKNTADAPAPAPAPAPKPQSPTATRPSSRGKGKKKQLEVVSTQQAQPKPEGKGKGKGKGEDEEEETGEQDTREEHEIAKLIKHRMASDKSGSVEILVQWVGEKEEDATWELEEEIQVGADEILYEYWKAQDGRINALFHKPKNPPPELYQVFKVLRHEKKNRGGFQFEVQWVGHPPTRGETSMESETKLRSTAPELLDEYWESVGGRASHLAPRGRGKKARTE